MTYLDLLPAASSLFCAALSILILIRRQSDPGFLALGVGMASLALMDLANIISLTALLEENVLIWKKISLLGELLFQSNWLLFTILFGKTRSRTILKKWNWIVPSGYFMLAIFFIFLLLTDQLVTLEGPQIIRLGTVGRYLNISLLLIAIISLVNLENTFRSSSGLERWRIKYMLFGIGSILVFYVYTLSQRILYNAIDANSSYLMSTVILTADFLIIYSIIYNKVIERNIYVSRKIIYSSISLIAIGLYSLVIALLAQLVKSFHIDTDLKLNALIIFFSTLILIIFFYKESFRRRTKAVINRHFRKNKYVYRDEWIVFSTELSKKINTEEVCEILLRTLSERIFVKNLSLWLLDEGQSRFYMKSAHNLRMTKMTIKTDDNVLRHLHNISMPLSKSDILDNKELHPVSSELSLLLDRTRAELLVPLILAERWVGLLILGKVQTDEPYDVEEDYGLLRSVAAHASSAINNAQLFEKNLRAKEVEAFNRLSCFVIHDLKNATSMLSMVTQNAERHLCNPEFQKDAFNAISGAVDRMKKIISSLSTLPEGLKLQSRDLDLNRLIDHSIDRVFKNGFSQVQIEKDFGPLPKVRIDADEMQKVLENLLLNASEAVDGRGSIRISSRAKGDQVVFSISDNGPGMSEEFIEKSLFQPFKSTKDNGLGVGLYQSKTIVEAHRGRIMVESKPETGSKFSVYLPVHPE
ncbi:MAG: PEP-CTERM system histidine kinase PrsK [Deltaproteobacteria bacterium]|nr:MAG: PEP-CTERM system histidine kinase PrsK [Deltaproteobacteria bacterium]